MDFRVADVRETVALDAWNGLDRLIVPIKTLCFFVIAPAGLQFQTTSPPIRYMRVLEANVWTDYLQHKTDKKKTLIYYWRNEPDKEVNPKSPFRVFLDLSKEPQSVNYLGLAILTALLVISGMLLITHWDSIQPYAVDLWSKWKRWVMSLTFVVVVGAIPKAKSYYQNIPLLKVQWKHLEDRRCKIGKT